MAGTEFVGVVKKICSAKGSQEGKWRRVVQIKLGKLRLGLEIGDATAVLECEQYG